MDREIAGEAVGGTPAGEVNRKNSREGVKTVNNSFLKYITRRGRYQKAG
jgi:hypothetical protein